MSVSLKPLSQQTIVITGASAGIGLVTAKMAAQQGARVLMAARNEEALQQAVAEIRQANGTASYLMTDVAQREDLEQLAAFAKAEFGGFDTWVNNAGLAIWGRLEEIPEAEHRRLFDTNFWGVVNGSVIALQHLKTHGGAIINLGSVASDMAFPIQGMYSASKFAIKGFSEALRREIIAEKAPVSVTLIQPAAVGTRFPEHARNETAQEPTLPPPIYRPEDVAEAILYCAQHPRRTMHVGGAGLGFTLMNRLAPGLIDSASSVLVKMQLRNQPAHPQEGELDEPGNDGAGRGGQSFIRPSLYTAARTHPAAAALVAGTALTVGVLALRRRTS